MTASCQSLCKQIALIEDDSKPVFLEQVRNLAAVFPRQEPLSWQCSHPHTLSRFAENVITVCFESKKIVVQLFRVLIVDDDDSLIKSIKDIIETNSNAIVTVASNGLSAINLIAHNAFEVILIDIKLPDIIGFDVLKFAKYKHPTAKTYLFSGQASTAHPNQHDFSRADGFFQKPLSPKVLLGLLPPQ